MASLTTSLMIIVIFWITLSHGHKHSSEDEVMEISQMVREMVSWKKYNKDIRPDFGGEPLKVTVTVSITDILDISDVNMDFTVDFHFRQSWRDPRLQFKPIMEHDHDNITKLFMGGDFPSLIWLPDTFVVNGKSLEAHKSTAVKRVNTLLELQYTGDILYSTRLTVVANCPMDLSYFPADKQQCRLDFGSYGYTVDDLVFDWAPGNESTSLKDRDVATFIVTGLKHTKIIDPSSVGDFSHLILYINFERSLGYYLYQTFIPAFLIVLISWVPFWLGPEDHVERVGIGVTTVLTITTLITSTMESLPKISYVKALDIYLFVCFLMVFLSLVEYAAVGYFEHKRHVKFIHKCACKTGRKVTDEILESRIFVDDYSRIDNISRMVFPCAFLLFNLVYIWFIFAVKEKVFRN